MARLSEERRDEILIRLDERVEALIKAREEDRVSFRELEEEVTGDNGLRTRTTKIEGSLKTNRLLITSAWVAIAGVATALITLFVNHVTGVAQAVAALLHLDGG